MEIHIQKCQACGSRNLRNILQRDRDQRVYVQCRDCEKFVARYIVSPAGYFHAGKDYESFLRSVARHPDLQSGRDIREWFAEVENHSQEEFDSLLEKAAAKYGPDLP
ncbi:hypothetical protein [Salinibius halmophilus]|uniref:hypothetical protein n=1 Tax=Salinibius halmophilus TaxID=1853216 RepID=UPI000E66A37F|nr:hypothetical protein [Salinibius halmophilus]